MNHNRRRGVVFDDDGNGQVGGSQSAKTTVRGDKDQVDRNQTNSETLAQSATAGCMGGGLETNPHWVSTFREPCHLSIGTIAYMAHVLIYTMTDTGTTSSDVSVDSLESTSTSLQRGG